VSHVVAPAVAILRALSRSATFAVMFGGALRLGPAALRRIAERPALFLRTLLAVWLAVPAWTVLVVAAFRLEGPGAATLLLMAGCPGVPLLLASTRTVRGAMNTAFVALVLTAATEPLLIPQWTRVVSRILPFDLTVEPRHILQVLVPTIFVPIALGFVVRTISARLAGVLARVSDWVYLVGIVGCVLFLVAGSLPLIARIPLWTLVAAVIITVGDAIIGYWAGWPDRDDQKAIALAAALGNPALALAVVEVSYPDHRAGPVVALYLLIRGVTLVPVEWLLKRLSDSQARFHRAPAH
jgi:bile acid:Na+ symporter, BASS family